MEQPNSQNPITPSDEALDSTPVDPEEAERKAISAKRMTLLLVVIGVILIALIIWELVDIGLGGIH